MTDVLRDYDRQLSAKGLDQHIGKEYTGLDGSHVRISRAGLIAAGHREEGATSRYLRRRAAGQSPTTDDDRRRDHRIEKRIRDTRSIQRVRELGLYDTRQGRFYQKTCLVLILNETTLRRRLTARPTAGQRPARVLEQRAVAGRGPRKRPTLRCATALTRRANMQDGHNRKAAPYGKTHQIDPFEDCPFARLQ